MVRQMILRTLALVGIALCCLSSAAPAQYYHYFEIACRYFGEEEHFVVAASDSVLLDQVWQQLSLPEVDRLLFIAGPIDYGNGGFNIGWSWHHLPDQWVLAECAVEACDGIPSFVEEDLLWYVWKIGYVCPWNSYVLAEIFPGCGDANGSGAVDIDDVVYLINHIFSQGPGPVPYESGDADCSGNVDIDDVVYLIAYVFSAGAEPCASC
jgi:hypothetical protein